MKKAVLVVRIVLGLIFLVFGINGFIQFIPVPELSESAGNFMGILASSGFLKLIKTLEVIGGLALLSGRFVPLGIFLLGPVIVNIVLFHAFLDPAGIGLGLLTLVLLSFLIYAHWNIFGEIFQPVS